MSRVELDRVVVRAATPGGPVPEVTVRQETSHHLTERRIALIGWQCAETYVRRSTHSLTIARISSSRN